MARKRIVVLVAVCFLAVAALVGGVLGRYGDPFDPFDNRRFSSTDWHVAEPEGRAQMCRDLIRHHLRPGMTEQEVLALLGDRRDLYDGGAQLARWPGARRLATYYLGGFPEYKGMDDAFLYVYFDDSSRLLGAEVYGY